jgi:hypothetical protein
MPYFLIGIHGAAMCCKDQLLLVERLSTPYFSCSEDIVAQAPEARSQSDVYIMIKIEPHKRV